MPDPFEAAEVVTDRNYSEITAEDAQSATSQGTPPPAPAEAATASQTAAAPNQGTNALAPEDLPDYITDLPESTLPAQPEGGEGEDLVLDEVTAEDEAYIAQAKTAEEFKERTQQVKKRIHDVNSARIGQFKARLRAQQAEMQALQRLVTSGRLPPSVVDMQQQEPGTPEPPVPIRQDVTDPRQLPEYAALVRAKAAMDAADPENFIAARDAYEAAQEAYFDAKTDLRLSSIQKRQQAVQMKERALEADREFDTTRTGDIVHPIPWADTKDSQGRTIPGVKSLFSQLVQADPTLPNRIQGDTPEDRADWMSHYVSRAFPQRHAAHLERVRAAMIQRTQQKRAASPVISGQTNPVKKTGSPATQTEDYLAYINQGR
jgi:hypothetical protein